MGILSRMESRSSLENPSTSLVDFFSGGSESVAGTRINNVTALNLSAVWASIRVLTDAVAVISLVTQERLADDGKQRATGHHLYDLLKLRPNPHMTAFTFWETTMGHLGSWGNSYAEKEMNGRGEVIALWPLRPDRTHVKVSDAGVKFYETTVNGEKIRLPASRVLHIPGFGFDGFKGYNPIHIARESLGLTQAAERFGSSFFGQGAKVAGVLEHPGALGPEATKALRNDWQDLHTGLSNAHRVAILEEGMKFTQIGVPPEDAQFLGTRKFQTTEVARWWKVPPHMIGDLERSTNNNIEQQSLEFVMYTMLPWLRRIEQAVAWDLFPASDRAKFFAEFNVEDLLRGDSASRAAYNKELWMIGAITQNEIRRRENLNTVEGGDRRYVPLNMVPTDQVDAVIDVPDDVPPPPDDEDDDAERAVRESRSLRSINLRKRNADAYLRIFDDTARRVLARELRQVRRGLKASFGARDGVKFRQWLDDFYADHNETVQSAFLGVLRSYLEVMLGTVGDELGDDVELTPTLERFLDDYGATLGTRWAGESAQQLRALIRDTEPDEIEAVLEQRLDEWEERRPGKIALRETYRAGNAFATAVYTAAGVLALRWVTTGDNCPLCRQLDGRVVSIVDNFLQKGDTVDPEDGETTPYRTRTNIKHPPLHNGCDCFVIASI